MIATQAARREVKTAFDILVPSLSPGTVTITMMNSVFVLAIARTRDYPSHLKTINSSHIELYRLNYHHPGNALRNFYTYRPLPFNLHGQLNQYITAIH